MVRSLAVWLRRLDLRVAGGILLIVFALYNLWRPRLPEIRQAGRIADGTVGLLNGILGGAAGLAGILPMIWCGLRGWSRDEQRAVFQPTAVATFVMILLWFGSTGAITADTIRLFAVGLPALILGTALGWALYGRLNEAPFRNIVLVLVSISGILLLGVGR